MEYYEIITFSKIQYKKMKVNCIYSSFSSPLYVISDLFNPHCMHLNEASKLTYAHDLQIHAKKSLH